MIETGRLLQSNAGRFAVQLGEETLVCAAKGTFRKAELAPVGGDLVEVDRARLLITKILPRKNFLIRPPSANVDMAWLVVSATQPKPSSLIIDSLLTIFAYLEIPAGLILTKTDLEECDRLLSIYRPAGYPVYLFCGKTGEGKEALMDAMKGKYNLFVGNSGVGKSTLLNHLAPDLSLHTAEISQKLGRGKHTTRQVTLYPIPGGGYLADTPGFSTVDLLQYGLTEEEKLVDCFPEMKEAVGHCRFSDCTHRTEPGCAVLELLSKGDIAPSRHENYLALYEQLRQVKHWQLK